MATRQYIGARYVPKFYENSDGTSAWRSGVIYEPLTIVTWNNNSYTSKKIVPATIGDPSNNPAYWVATGMFNQQIADLSSRVDNLERETAGINAPPVNILTLGAKNDGSEDVSSIINQYTDDYSLYFPIGKYRLDSPCIVKNNIIGAVSARGGDTVEFIANHSGTIFSAEPAYNEKEIVFRDFQIEGNNIAANGIRLSATVRAFIDIDSVDILHCKEIAINISPYYGSSRCARINNVIINGPSDLSNIPPADYGKIIGILVASNVPDGEISNVQVMYCTCGMRINGGNTRISNVHVYCSTNSPGLSLNEWAGATIGIDASEKVIGSSIYVDTALQAFVQRAKCSIISNFTYWDDGGFGGTGRTDANILSTRSNASILLGNVLVGGDPTTIQQITVSPTIKINHLHNEFGAGYYANLNYPRKFALIGYNTEYKTIRVSRSSLTANHYGEVCRVYVSGGYAEIGIGLGSGITKIGIRHSGSNWTVTKLSETFPGDIYYKTDGEYITFFAQHQATLEAIISPLCFGGILCGLCVTDECMNYPFTDLENASTLTKLT